MRVINGDPFAALDSKKAGKEDELSSKFPTLDEFDLLHDKGASFDFSSSTPTPPASGKATQDLSKRVSEHLVDEVFAQPRGSPSKAAEPIMPKTVVPTNTSPPTGPVAAAGLTKVQPAPPKPSRAYEIISSDPHLKAIASQSSQASQPYKPTKPAMVSTGTMTSIPPNLPPIHRFPPTDQFRPSSSLPKPDLLQKPRAESTASALQPIHNRHPSSSRPSLEGGRPNADLLDFSIPHQVAPGTQQRPVSMNVESSLDYLREREASSKAQPAPYNKPAVSLGKGTPTEEDGTTDDEVEMEKADFKKSHKHGKRSSLGSLSGTKNMLAGKFGDAFKKFESHTVPAAPPRTPSPLKSMERRDLTPIAGSEATDGRSDDGRAVEDLDALSPEMRREMERRQLEEEERRVEAAAAQYRQRVAQKDSAAAPLPRSIGGVSRAVSIQNRVQSLLNEGGKSSSNVQKTAQGYGKYTDSSGPAREKQLPYIPRKPVGGISKSQPLPPTVSGVTAASGARPDGSKAAPPTGPKPALPPKPMAPRKPVHLNSIPTGARAGSPPKPAIPPSSQGSSSQALSELTLDMTQAEKDDYIRDFTKRYPSLSAIEMVEAKIPGLDEKK